MPFFIYLFIVFNYRQERYPVLLNIIICILLSIWFCFIILDKNKIFTSYFSDFSLGTASFVENFNDKRFLMKVMAVFILYPLIYRFPFTNKSHFQDLPVALGLQKRE